MTGRVQDPSMTGDIPSPANLAETSHLLHFDTPVQESQEDTENYPHTVGHPASPGHQQQWPRYSREPNSLYRYSDITPM